MSDPPRIYYSDPWTTLYLGDCRDVLPTLPRASVDLIVTDPPYGVGFASHRRKTVPEYGRIAGDDGSLDVLAVLRQAIKALRPRRHIYVFGPFDITGLPVSGVTELVWDKVDHTGGNLESPWASVHERITFAVQASAAQRRAGDGALAARLRKGSILRYPRLHGCASVHPTQKPVPLLRELVESSSRLGETVLDPFAGAGSTLVAAKLEGRTSIGIEIDERYAVAAATRLRAIVLPDEAALAGPACR